MNVFRLCLLFFFVQARFANSTSVHRAAAMCDANEVEFNLKKGFNPESSDVHTGTLLIAWATLRELEEFIEVSPCDAKCQDSKQNARLHACIQTFKILIAYRANIN